MVSVAISVRRLLEEGLVVSVGCTEPVSVALATAAAARAAHGGPGPRPEEVERIEVDLVLGFYKNALQVPIPNTGGRSGVPLAAALGVACHPEAGLRLLEDLAPSAVDRALRLVDEGRVGATVREPGTGGLVEARVWAAGHLGRALLAGSHASLARLERDGRPLPAEREARRGASYETPAGIGPGVTLADLVAAVEAATPEDLERVEAALALNADACRRAVGCGDHGIGGSLRSWATGPDQEAAALAACGSEARMRGLPLPVMTSCGSGNQGLLVLVPIGEIARRLRLPRQRTLRAAALAHLVTSYATERIGLLSPLCGLAAKAGPGAAAGLCYLLGGDAAAVGRAVRLMVASLAGAMCDGAKPGCALKLAASAEAALRAARMALGCDPLRGGAGIESARAEAAIGNLAALARTMKQADRTMFETLRRQAERS